jgi:hypothetical protein
MAKANQKWSGYELTATFKIPCDHANFEQARAAMDFIETLKAKTAFAELPAGSTVEVSDPKFVRRKIEEVAEVASIPLGGQHTSAPQQQASDNIPPFLDRRQAKG